MSAAEAADAERERLLVRLATSVAPRGYRLAVGLLHDRAEAEDAVQEALARACESWERVREPGAVEGWFYRVLTNVCLRTLRRRRLRRLLPGRGQEPAPSEQAPAAMTGAPAATVPDTEAGTVPGVVPQGAPGADRALARHQELDWMMRGLDRLPPMQRVAVLLRYGHDRSIAEIAALLDVKPATVKTHLVRGLRRLRTYMERM